MRTRFRQPLLLAFLLTLPVRGEPARPSGRAELAARLAQSVAATAAPGAQWGVKAVSLKTGKTLFETNATRLFVPASNTKLFTGALALDRLGADRTLATTLWVPATRTGETVAGDLLVRGGGDPTLSDRLKDRWEMVFAPFVAAVSKAGIRRIHGDLVCDESQFRGAPYGSGWNWDDLGYYYGAAVSALSVNDNVLHLRVTPGKAVGAPATLQLGPLTNLLELIGTVRTGPTNSAVNLQTGRLPGESRLRVGGSVPLGSPAHTADVPVPSPARYFGELFREALRQSGIIVTGDVRVVDWRARAAQPWVPAEWRQVGQVSSAKLADVVTEMMKPSQNFYAHCLWLLAGVQAERQPVGSEVGKPLPDTTEESGVRALRTFLATAGVPAHDAVFEEGSGLSRKNLVTPNALVQLLVHMHRHPAAAAYRESLPVGGVDGTLKRRFTAAETKGRIRAKTGTLRHVTALSGYVDTRAGEPVAFSILVNAFVPVREGATATQEADRLVELIAGFTGRLEAE